MNSLAFRPKRSSRQVCLVFAVSATAFTGCRDAPPGKRVEATYDQATGKLSQLTMDATKDGKPNITSYMDGSKFQRIEIAAMFGVPPHKIDDLERATFSNIEHQAIEVVTDTIRPWAVAWEQALTRDLFTQEMRRTHMLAFNLDGLLRGDIESRYRAYATGRQWAGSLPTTFVSAKT